ncbi:MAG: DUF177 domain-containing protein [Bacteroidota bacterium]
MEKERAFRRKYSINVARLGTGKHTDFFEIDQDFFARFEQSEIEEGKVAANLEIDKSPTHLDVGFHLKGEVELPCDRCGVPYPYQLEANFRIIYSFDPEMNFEGYEVMYVNEKESHLVIVQELYDFIQLALPMRRVPPKEIHLCAPEVLKMLGLDENGEPVKQAEEKETDPRWAALKGLKDQMEG